MLGAGIKTVATKNNVNVDLTHHEPSVPFKIFLMCFKKDMNGRDYKTLFNEQNSLNIKKKSLKKTNIHNYRLFLNG